MFYPLTQDSAIDFHCGVRYRVPVRACIIVDSERCGKIPRNQQSLPQSPGTSEHASCSRFQVGSHSYRNGALSKWNLREKVYFVLVVGLLTCPLLPISWNLRVSTFFTKIICIAANQHEPFVSRTRKFSFWKVFLSETAWELCWFPCFLCEKPQLGYSIALNNWDGNPSRLSVLGQLTSHTRPLVTAMPLVFLALFCPDLHFSVINKLWYAL